MGPETLESESSLGTGLRGLGSGGGLLTLARPGPDGRDAAARRGAERDAQTRASPHPSPRPESLFWCHGPPETAARKREVCPGDGESAGGSSGGERTGSQLRRRVRPSRSGRFQNAASGFRRPRPRRGFPAARLICMARPSPAAIGRSRAPPSPAPPSAVGFRPPSARSCGQRADC